MKRPAWMKRPEWMPVWAMQFLMNFFFGTIVSAIWYYGAYIWSESFWISTIVTNVYTFFLSRYVVYREGAK